MSGWDQAPDYLGCSVWLKLIGLAVVGFGFVFGVLPDLIR